MRIRIFLKDESRANDFIYDPEIIRYIKTSPPAWVEFKLLSGGTAGFKIEDVNNYLILTDDNIKNSIRDSKMFEDFEESLDAKKENWE